MQNVHAHAWDEALHLTPETVREAEISRGFPSDLTVKIRWNSWRTTRRSKRSWSSA